MPNRKYPGKRKPKKTVNETEAKQIAYRQAQKAISGAAEHKFYQVQTWAGGATSTSTPGIGSLCPIPQETTGATDQVREGDECYLRSLQMRGTLHFNTATTASAQIFRIILFQWLQNDPPIASDILANTTYGMTAQYRKDNNQNYKILYDKVMVVHADTPVKYFKFNVIRGFKKKLKFMAGTTQGSNQIWFLNVSDAGANPPSYSFLSTVNYTDS